MSIVYIGKMVAAPGKREELEKLFQNFKGIPGLIRFESYRQTEDGDTIMCIEEWKDQESRDTFFASMPQDQEATWMALLVQRPESARYKRV